MEILAKQKAKFKNMKMDNCTLADETEVKSLHLSHQAKEAKHKRDDAQAEREHQQARESVAKDTSKEAVAVREKGLKKEQAAQGKVTNVKQLKIDVVEKNEKKMQRAMERGIEARKREAERQSKSSQEMSTKLEKLSGDELEAKGDVRKYTKAVTVAGDGTKEVEGKIDVAG